MSDYGDDDYSDYGEWLYVEDEYLPADDLAEHAIGSPPWLPMDDGYESEELDRYEYFLDLEYGSDGNDDNAKYYTHKPESDKEKLGKKRKRAVVAAGKKKRQKSEDGLPPLDPTVPKYPPVVWRAQADRDIKPKMLEEDTETEPFALMKDWRERLAELPAWPEVQQRNSEAPQVSNPEASKLAQVSEALSPSMEEDEDDLEDEAGVGEAALMAALQKNLAAAGGPLSGMDPQQLLQFAMRMMNDQGAGDDIAGELADDLLAQGQDDGDEAEGDDGPADLMDWLSKSRAPADATPSSSTPAGKLGSKQPPTPPSSEATRSYFAPEDAEQKNTKSEIASAFKQNSDSKDIKQELPNNRKRKVNDDVDAKSAPAPKKRATRSTRSFDAPTAASRAKAAPAPAPAPAPAVGKGRSTRSTRRS